MQARSWMAAFVVVASLAAIRTVSADDEAAAPKKAVEGQKTAASKPKGDKYSVKLELRIAGLGAEGCDVELKPAHRGCTFETIKKHVTRSGELLVVVDDIKSLNADRDCTFAITIKEPGHPVRTERRGLRLARTNATVQSLPCFLSSPSKLAKSDTATDTKR